jgi:hypothetical protein
MKKISFDRNLTKSTAIWKAPFRPIRTGPTRRITYAKTLRSVSAMNRRKRMEIKDIIKPVSLMALSFKRIG